LKGENFALGLSRTQLILVHRTPEAGFLVRVHPEPCLILSRTQIRALLCSSKSKFISAWTLTLLVLDKKTGLRREIRVDKGLFAPKPFLALNPQS
jgi:hypothetical protein